MNDKLSVVPFRDYSRAFEEASRAMKEIFSIDPFELDLISLRLQTQNPETELEKNVVKWTMDIKAYIDGSVTRAVEFTKLGYTVTFYGPTLLMFRQGRGKLALNIATLSVKGRF